ncbi:unnamed protein product [Hermetia illucens]|uniref:Uncharacterized protein n=1 Tax=Hermetia illucens TaxID=343691 RepID=A0A7R8YM74_HERIL|nr:unnamed protein product [Hermetia illucens]
MSRGQCSYDDIAQTLVEYNSKGPKEALDQTDEECVLSAIASESDNLKVDSEENKEPVNILSPLKKLNSLQIQVKNRKVRCDCDSISRSNECK